MLRAVTAIFAAACVTTLAGCGVQGEAYRPRPIPAAQSLIYIYRPYKFLSSQAAPMVTCGHDSVELEPGGFYEFVQDSGTLTCAVAGDQTADYKFDTRAGERYFIKEEVDADGLATRVRFIPMDADVGRDEIKACSLQGIKQ
ncbi:MAG: hypothetical protein ACREQH_04885 [Candidatus Binatus sp.]